MVKEPCLSEDHSAIYQQTCAAFQLKDRHTAGIMASQRIAYTNGNETAAKDTLAPKILCEQQQYTDKNKFISHGIGIKSHLSKINF
jgi:hypothetical protein